MGYDGDDSGILFWYNQKIYIYILWTIIRINHKYLRCHWNDGVNKGVSYPKWQDFSDLWFIIFYSTRRQIKNISLCHFKWISSLLVPGEDIEIHMVHFPAEESLRTAAQIRNLGVGACFTSALIGGGLPFFSPCRGELYCITLALFLTVQPQVFHTLW